MTIYFIQAVDCGRIKIGYTEYADPNKRISGLSTSNPSELKLLAHCGGSDTRERELHRLFWASRVRGEWFLPSQQLLSLIKYAKVQHTTDRWEETEVGAEEWAAMAKQFRLSRRAPSMTFEETKVHWASSLEQQYYRDNQAEKSKERRKIAWDSLDLWDFLSVERGRIQSPVVHSTQPDDYRATDFGWLVNGARFQESKAAVQTVRMLSSAVTSDDIIAIWIGACIHSLTNSKRGNSYLAQERVPDLLAIESACRGRIDGWWPHLGVSALPMHFSIPERCILSRKEFLHMVARHMRATLSCCVPVAIWAHGSACGLSQYPNKVAA